MIRTNTPLSHAKDLGRHENRALTIEANGEEQKIPCTRCKERNLSCVKYETYAACNNCTRMRRKCTGRTSTEEPDEVSESGKTTDAQRRSKMETRRFNTDPDPEPEHDPEPESDTIDFEDWQTESLEPHGSDPARMEWKEDEFTQDLFSYTAVATDGLKRKRQDDESLNSGTIDKIEEKRQRFGGSSSPFKTETPLLGSSLHHSSPASSSHEESTNMLDIDGRTKLSAPNSPPMSNRQEIEILLNEMDDPPSAVRIIQQDSHSSPSSRPGSSSNDSGDTTSATSNQDDRLEVKDLPPSPIHLKLFENVGIQVGPLTFADKYTQNTCLVSEVSIQTTSAPDPEPSPECPGTPSSYLNDRGKCFDRHPSDGRDCGCQIFYPQSSSDKRCLCGHWFVFHARSDGQL
ncbi:hypothetical protein NEOLI_000366 [Neolecta irregularis DAH-3]|uniref:Zn(2)-C6 fungal-type domain-containing protein n=1 Tax=Neolecta irregularis (strain DAH-3) TaxID=1198029 RepID=A0A1U7LNK2_NEOID|nr:hypothetical protein NEOLI_000366 [Neolecta irregularis DAH-3]|eukprot:OLL24122.1 hypothetical protein NEOLI_000366 [Neolecta irregularis DAH-3]